MLLIGPELGEGNGSDLVIGLVNCMPPKASRQTEAQFAGLLQDAASGMRVRLRCFAPSGLRPPHCEDIGTLWQTKLDGLIVTGVEPGAGAMEDEPLWPTLARLIDWAAENTSGAIWSCLAGHAAVQRLSGLRRNRLPAKLSGVYQCERASAHTLLTGAPERWLVPHSRHNDLDAAALVAAGYEILSYGRFMGAQGRLARGPQDQGVDSCVKQVGRSQFVILQGHPEYAGDSLLLEYRRDIRRFLLGQRADWPAMPAHYLDEDTEAAMARLQYGAAGLSAAEAMAAFDAHIATIPLPRWHAQGNRLFANWLAGIAAARATPAQPLAVAVS